jgi:hypothetical protein
MFLCLWLIAKAKEEAMERYARAAVWAIVIGTSQLPPAAQIMANSLEANAQSTIVVAQASPTPSKAKDSKVARVKQSRTYSSRRPAEAVNRPAASSESAFGGKKFWKEQEDN